MFMVDISFLEKKNVKQLKYLLMRSIIMYYNFKIFKSVVEILKCLKLSIYCVWSYVSLTFKASC